MRDRDEIEKDIVDLGWVNNIMAKDKKALLVNPQLQLEVLLDIRDLLIEIKEKGNI